MSSTLISRQSLTQVLSHFPSKYSLAFAYGSGVFKQEITNQVKSIDNKNNLMAKMKTTSNMIDLILVVDDPIEWHKENLLRNRWHYSFIKYFGSKVIAGVQQNFDAKVYFNTLIPIDDQIIKYGVISTKHLINDLLDWETLYISGRLHKPVLFLIDKITNDELEKSVKINYQSAIHSSLLMLPEVFTEEQLYFTIAGLSYSGDFRMIIGEDKQKIKKIVEPQLIKFRQLYQPILTSDIMNNILHWDSHSQNYIQDCCSRVILHHLNLLPKTIQQNLYVAWNVNRRLRDLDDVLQSLSKSYDCQLYVRQAIEKVVWKSSWYQSVKGVFTAGMFKSLRYGSNKLVKMFKSINIRS